jgi:hypothetical protein
MHYLLYDFAEGMAHLSNWQLALAISPFFLGVGALALSQLLSQIGWPKRKKGSEK